MSTFGERTITAEMNTSGRWKYFGYPGNMVRFPEELLTEGPCEMDVSTYVFWYPTDSVERFEKNFEVLRSDKWGPRHNRNYQFLMCCAEIDERGKTEVQGMVQYDKKLHSFECKDTTYAAYGLKKVFAPYCARFFHKIQDGNVNNVYRWLKKRGTGNDIRTFKRGVFVGVVDPEPEVTRLVGEMQKWTT